MSQKKLNRLALIALLAQCALLLMASFRIPADIFPGQERRLFPAQKLHAGEEPPAPPPLLSFQNCAAVCLMGLLVAADLAFLAWGIGFLANGLFRGRKRALLALLLGFAQPMRVLLLLLASASTYPHGSWPEWPTWVEVCVGAAGLLLLGLHAFNVLFGLLLMLLGFASLFWTRPTARPS